MEISTSHIIDNNTIRNAGNKALDSVFGFILLIVFISLPVLFLMGGLWLGEKLLPLLTLLSLFTFGVDIVILLPLTLFPATRPSAGLGFVISSYIYGITVWFMGLLMSWILWGGFAVGIGLFIFGIGVVPIAMLATLFNGLWLELGVLVLTTGLSIGFRILGLLLTDYE